MALSHVVSQLSWIGSLVVLAALVSPAALGGVTIAMVLIQVAWLVVGSGTRGSIVVSEDMGGDRLMGTVTFNVAAALVLGGGIALLAGPIIELLTPGADPAVLRWLTLSIVFYALSIVPLALLQKTLDFKLHAGAVGAAALVASLIAVVAGLAGAGVWALVARQILFQLLSALFAWAAVRRVGALPGRLRLSLPALRAGMGDRPHAMSFFVLALISFVAMNMDYVIVGRVTDVTLLGVYALAFTLAFAPQTQFAWQVGKVLFPAAAATTDPADVARRCVRAIRLTATVLLPLVPAAIVLSDPVLPWLFGPEWAPIVVPFQLLLIAGVSHGVLAILREFLLGTGNVAFCARVESVWLVGDLVALLVLVQLSGIRGAALAHLVVLVPLAAVYVHAGSRRLAIERGRLAGAVAGVVAPVLVQAAATAGAWFALAPSLPDGLAAALAAALGIAVFAFAGSRGASSPLREGRAVVTAAVSGRA